MPKISQEWANCINRILEDHGLNHRQACKKGDRLYSHTTIREWGLDGVVPAYRDELPRFLELISSREEAIGCLQAAGLPLPTEWAEHALTPAALDAILADMEAQHPEWALTADDREKLKEIIRNAIEAT